MKECYVAATKLSETTKANGNLSGMRNFFIILMATAALSTACQNLENPSRTDSYETLTAQIEQDGISRTSMDGHGNILWSENDQIIGYLKSSYGYRYQVKPGFVGKTYADFSKVHGSSGDDLSAGSEWDHIVAYYPYSEDIECMRSGDTYSLSVVLPSEQTYTVDSFCNGSFPMVAVSPDNSITFRNICGGMRLQLKGTQKVTSIKIEGKNGEKLSGAAVVTGYSDSSKPSIEMSEKASETACLNCGEGVQLNEETATEFIISLPPTEFSKGFTVTITDSDSQEHTIETGKKNSVLRSSLLTMPAVSIGPEDESKIEYTLSQGYASEGTLNNSAAHRVKTSFIYGSFSVKVNEGYVIRAVYTYPEAKVTDNFGCVLKNCTDRTEINVQNENRYAIVTFAKASDPNAGISPSEDIVKSLTKYEIVLPEPLPGSQYISRAVFFGDSIMHGVYSFFETGADGKTLRKNGFDSDSNTHLRIPDYFGLMAGASVTNNAKRGSGWITDTRNWGNALEMSSQTDFSQYDFAAFCLGINDWIQGAATGSLEQPGNTGGAINQGTVVANMIACFEKVKKDNPSCNIVVYSPYISWGQYSDGGDYTSKDLYGNESTGYALGAKNKAGYTLQELIDLIDDVCRHYGIPHVQLSKSKVCTISNVKDIMIDGLHPSREIREALAKEIFEEGVKCISEGSSGLDMKPEEGHL